MGQTDGAFARWEPFPAPLRAVLALPRERGGRVRLLAAIHGKHPAPVATYGRELRATIGTVIAELAA